MSDESPRTTGAESAQRFELTVSGVFEPLARRLLGAAPGAHAFGSGLFVVCVGLAMQVLGSWFAGLLSPDIVMTRLFMVLATTYTVAVGLVVFCGVMTMLAGAIRYGVGATDR